MRAEVHTDICIGCTLCVQTCPEVFKMEFDKAVVYKTPVPTDLEDQCKKAASECPVEAIKIEY